MIDGLDDMAVKKESYRLFEDQRITFSSQPDHVIKSDGEPVAILDSKYYSKGRDPLKGGWSRSRLLSYGFHLNVEDLGMIAPMASPESYAFAGRSGELSIISPENENFSTEGLRKAIRKYIRDHFAVTRETNATTDLQNRKVCHPDVEASLLEDVFDEGRLRRSNIINDSREILKYIIKEARLSEKVNPRDTRKLLAANRAFKRYLREESEGYEIIIPFFISANDDEAEIISTDQELLNERPSLEEASEFIRLHCLAVDEDGLVIDYRSPPPFGLPW
jgi:hypothetical protein